MTHGARLARMRGPVAFVETRFRSMLQQSVLRVALGLMVLVVIVPTNLWLAGRSIGILSNNAPAVDWSQYVDAASRFWNSGDLYAWTTSYGYHYSPLLAPLFGVLAPLGVIGWRAIHLLAALALPSWPMRLVVLISWPFWFDVEAGNILTFILLAAAWALRGSRIAGIAYLALLILVPRPLMLPVAVWLLWRQPWLRLPFAGLLVAHALAVLLTGWGPDWLNALILASHDVLSPVNVGPSRFIGSWWVLVGLPFAAWLTIRGHVGWASLCASPYWLPYYLLMPVLELQRAPEVPSAGTGDLQTVVSMPASNRRAAD
jgi:hypothetical protein